MNVKQAKAKRLSMAERAATLMDLQFPGFDKRYLWNRKQNDGYSTVPRTLPIAMQAIDAASKSQPAGHVLFCLWARSPDHPLLKIDNPAAFAAEAGFSGARMVDTWRRRMKQLVTLGFIMARPGDLGDFQYVLLLNPNMGVEYMRAHKLVQDGIYSRFIERLAEVGAAGEIDQVRMLWAEHQAAAAAAAAAASTVGAQPQL